MAALNSEPQFPNSTPRDKDAAERSTACSACGSDAFLTIMDSYDFDSGTQRFSLEQCQQCLLIRTSPLLSDSQLSPYYTQPYYGAGSQKFGTIIERWVQFTNRKKAEHIRKLIRAKNDTPEILDIGCGRAQLLTALSQSGCNCTGIERSDFPIETKEEIKIFNEDFLQINLPENNYDAVILWHVLEHLSNPLKTIEKIEKILKPGGIFLVAVPNFGSYQAQLFGKHWFHLDLPRHTYHFTTTYLDKILHNHRLITTKQHTWTFDQSLFGFLQSSINATGLFPPNSLYSLLKSKNSRPGFVSAVAQSLLAVLISSFALLEYALSGLMGKGSCIVICAQKPG